MTGVQTCALPICNRIADPYIIGPAAGVPPAPYWWAYWAMMFCNVIVPQFFWFKPCRQKAWLVLILVMGPNIGMWFERFVIIVTSLHRDFMPGAWGHFVPTINDILLFTGTIGLFVFLFLLFVRFFPMITMFEVKAVLPEADPHHHDEARPDPGAHAGAIQGEVRSILASREAKEKGGHA